ncbi:MAG: hypothetical protein IPM71_00075 [Bacteroidota bacterium]|nr:MAG: hypothetical protein IPM71_00075 [Bacteroidota bacterium]
MKPQKTNLFLLLLFWLPLLVAQEGFIDKATKNHFDSLDSRIVQLNQQLKAYGTERHAQYFYVRREIDMTLFVREFDQWVYDENLLQAQILTDSRKAASEKRFDNYGVEYYSAYQAKITQLRADKMRHYQSLLEKEKNFKKEYLQYIAPADEAAYLKTLRMIDLALKYTEETGRNETRAYLLFYQTHTRALLYDFYSKYDLAELTNNQNAFLKAFEPMLESDSLKQILEGQELAKQCYNYTLGANSKLDTNYFALQKIAAANAIADWNERQGLSSELSSLTGQAVLARRDSLNREGIYQWNDLIIVIGSVNFSSKSEAVRRGEAIIDADKTLFEYLRVNKYSNTASKVNLDQTTLLPVKDKDRVVFFQYDPSCDAWQYIIAYNEVMSKKFTIEMSQFLPPLQFQEDIDKGIEANGIN